MNRIQTYIDTVENLGGVIISAESLVEGMRNLNPKEYEGLQKWNIQPKDIWIKISGKKEKLPEASRMLVYGRVDLTGLQWDHQLNLEGFIFLGNVIANECTVEGSLSLNGTRVTGGVLARQLQCEGDVTFAGAQIDGIEYPFDEPSDLKNLVFVRQWGYWARLSQLTTALGDEELDELAEELKRALDPKKTAEDTEPARVFEKISAFLNHCLGYPYLARKQRDRLMPLAERLLGAMKDQDEDLLGTAYNQFVETLSLCRVFVEIDKDFQATENEAQFGSSNVADQIAEAMNYIDLEKAAWKQSPPDPKVKTENHAGKDEEEWVPLVEGVYLSKVHPDLNKQPNIIETYLESAAFIKIRFNDIELFKSLKEMIEIAIKKDKPEAQEKPVILQFLDQYATQENLPGDEKYIRLLKSDSLIFFDLLIKIDSYIGEGDTDVK